MFNLILHIKQVCYGTTENSPVTFQNFRDDNIEKKVGTIGKPHPHVEVIIFDNIDAISIQVWNNK